MYVLRGSFRVRCHPSGRMPILALLWMVLLTRATSAGQVCGARDVFGEGAETGDYSRASIPSDCLWMLLMNNKFIEATEGEAQAYKDTFRAIAGVNLLEHIPSSIGDGGAKTLANELEGNSRLKLLFLWGNNIGPAGADALGAALAKNAVLTQLYLQENVLGDAGLVALSEALAVNTGLKKLYLDGNQVGNVGAAALLEALQINTELVGVELGNAGSITNQTLAPAIAEALAASADPELRQAKVRRAKLANTCGGYTRQNLCNSKGNPIVETKSWMSRLVRAAKAMSAKLAKQRCICENCDQGYGGDFCDAAAEVQEDTDSSPLSSPPPSPIPKGGHKEERTDL